MARTAEYLNYFTGNRPALMSDPLTEEEVNLSAQEIIQHHQLNCSTDGLTLAQIALDESICFYVGTTKQYDIKIEDLRWLTDRGKTPNKNKIKIKTRRRINTTDRC